MSEDITSASVPAGASEGSASSEGGETASTGASQSVAKVLSEVLGKEFKDDASALKSVKDTFNYVGDVGRIKNEINRVKETTGLSQEEILGRLSQADQPAKQEVSVQDEIKALRGELEESKFFAERPDLKEYSATLNEIRSSTGQSLREIAESESFKPILEKARAYDESQKSRSVLESSPRLGRVKDKIQEAKKLADSGDHRSAGKSAVGAVLDAYDMK